MMGAIILQGPHQGAQKSTTTGVALPFIWLSNVSSVNSKMSAAMPHFPFDWLVE
jgi:hypothetical protein